MRIASAVSRLSLVSALAFGCSVEQTPDGGDEDFSTPRAATAEADGVGEPDALADAMLVVDMAVQTLTTTPQGELQWAVGYVQDLTATVDFDKLDEDDIAILRDYLQSYTEALTPVFTNLSAAGIPFNAGLGGEFGDPIVPPGMCPTRCALFFETSCGGGGFVGMCFDIWDCDSGEGFHECGPTAPPLPRQCDGEVCGAGERCARWLFKPHECVQTCETHADCSGGERCKQPAGTLFKRCK